MNFKEFFLGTPQEGAAKKTISRLKSKPNLNSKDESRLRDAEGMSRRKFLRIGGATVVSGLVLLIGGGAIFKALENVGEQENDENYALGEKIRNWTLPDGTNMNIIIPELNEAGNVFQKKSLEDLLPTAIQPLTVTYFNEGVATGRLGLDFKFSEDNIVKVVTETPGAPPFDMPLLTALEPKIFLLKSMKGTVAELTVAAKEAMQIVDFNKYCKFFRSTLEDKGLKFTLVKPDEINISENLVNASIAIFQHQIQLEKDGFSWFQKLVDLGAFIRMGGIAYANWKVNYPHERSLVSEKYISAGENQAGLLQHEGIIVQSGRAVKYTQGSAPQIGSPEFQSLLSKASGSTPKG